MSTAQAAPDSPLVALRGRQGAALIGATVLSSMRAFFNAAVVNVAVPAISSVMVALVPLLLGVADGDLASAPGDGYQRAMLVMSGLAVAAAAVAALSVSDSPATPPRFPLPPQVHSSAVPVRDPALVRSRAS